jgi:hypothetical protein
MIHLARSFILRGIIASPLLMIGCSYSTYRPETVKKRSSFIYSSRKYAAPLVYNRIKIVRSPSPVPLTKAPIESRPVLVPPLRLISTENSLESVASALARSVGYSHVCAPSLASRIVTIEANGDIDTISRLIANQEQITVIVDHNSRLLQFLTTNQ